MLGIALLKAMQSLTSSLLVGGMGEGEVEKELSWRCIIRIRAVLTVMVRYGVKKVSFW